MGIGWPAFALGVCLASGTPVFGAQSREDKLAGKYYDNWLNQDVLYIITDEERDVFSKLQTTEEKDSFIDGFWRRRSPTPNSERNGFKEEHYRRIAYANAHYGTGIPGWKTDRGRTYIMFGEPAEIEDYSGGQNYTRKPWEGGGSTNVYPFQVWRYRHIDGIGDDIEIEFVDKTWSGLYRMVTNPWEKDMLVNIDGAGLTTSERLGLARREQRPGLHPGHLNDTTAVTRYGMRSRDLPFERMLQYFQLQRPPVIRHKELQSAIQARVTYNSLPFRWTLNYVWIDGEKALVPITLEIENQVLNFVRTYSSYKARVALYGVVTSLNGRIVAEFEDSIASEYAEERFPQGKVQKSMYQRPVLLPTGLYKIDLAVKDLNTGEMGTVSSNLNIPRLESDSLAASPILLAKMIQPVDKLPDAPQTFVIGDLKVVPNVTQKYRPADHMSIYFQVYNAGRDASEQRPRLVTQYSIVQGDKTLSTLTDNGGTSIEYASDVRTVLARRIPLKDLQPGKYKLKVEISDLVKAQTITRDTLFEIAAP
jgi:GWxTD domain-containing protein